MLRTSRRLRWLSVAPLLLIVCAMLAPASVNACPFCNSEIGRQVNAGVFDEKFWSNVTLLVLPFVVLLLIVAAIHVGWPAERREMPTGRDATF